MVLFPIPDVDPTNPTSARGPLSMGNMYVPAGARHPVQPAKLALI